MAKAAVQARYLSGRGRVEALTKHWDMANQEGICSLCKDVEPVVGTLEHILLSGGCPALAEARLTMLSFFQAYMVSRPYLLPLMQACWEKEEPLTMQLILDCSVIPLIIKTSQESSQPISKDIFYMMLTFVFKIYTTRRRL